MVKNIIIYKKKYKLYYMRRDILLDILSKFKISIFFVVVAVIVIIILILYFTGVFNKSSNNTTNNNTTNNNTTNTDVVNSDKINNALRRANITVLDKDTFQNNNDVVFDSVDKIINNFDLFITTYYPSLDINDLNNILKNYGVPKTMQEILIENKDLPNMNRSIINIIIMLAFQILTMSMNNSNDIICAGLSIIITNNLIVDNKMNQKMVYLNDFNTTDDFYIYFLPSSYDTSKLSNITDIDKINFMDRNIPNYYDVNNLIKPYKIGIMSATKKTIKESIVSFKISQLNLSNPSATIDSNSITASDDEINQRIKLINDNRASLYEFMKLRLLAAFVILYTKTDLTLSSQILKDLIELLTPSNNKISSELLTLLPPVHSIDKSDMNRQNSFNYFNVILQ
jgi:hypothetical protein